METRAQREKNACIKQKLKVTITFHNKTSSTQIYVVIILKYFTSKNFVG